MRYEYRAFGQDVVAGEAAISRLPDELDRIGARRCLVLCGPNIAKTSDVVERVEASLGSRCVARYAEVEPHAPLRNVARATSIARDGGVDCLVSVGGGSTHMVSKGVALELSSPLGIRAFERRFEPPDRVILPAADMPPIVASVVAVPTTIGSAEIGPSGGSFADEDNARKLFVYGNGSTAPKVIVLDGRALATTPERIQRASAMGQLRVGIEAFLTRNHNPISDALSLHAIELLASSLDSGWERSPSLMLRLKSAGVLAEMGLHAAGRLAINSAIAHQVGAIAGGLHGEINSILLPHTLRMNVPTMTSDRRRRLEAALGAADAAGAPGCPAADAVARLAARLGVPAQLRDIGVRRDAFHRIAEATLMDWTLGGNPTPIVDEAPILSILETAW